MIRLRVRYETGLSMLNDVDRDTTFGELKEKISDTTGIPVNMVQVKCGFPPVTISIADDTLLQDTQISDGETLIVTRVAQEPYLTSIQSSNITGEDILKSPRSHTSDKDLAISVGEGYLVRRIVPSDNNCLFHSLGRCLGDKNLSPKQLRHIVCDKIIENQGVYNEVVLGRSVNEYCNWITRDTSWGGGIELAIFSDEFEIEICSIDIQTLRIDRFGEGKHPQRVVLLYSGIHYDYAAFTYDLSSPTEFDLTVFNVGGDGDDEKLSAARELASILREKHEFTDTANFVLKCNQCNTVLRGEHEAQEHTMKTMHTDYVEQ